jgi:hypothetical protein
MVAFCFFEGVPVNRHLVTIDIIQLLPMIKNFALWTTGLGSVGKTGAEARESLYLIAAHLHGCDNRKLIRRRVISDRDRYS